MNLTVFKKIFIPLAFATPLILVAQPGDPSGGRNPTVPISGVEILIGTGAVLGLKKMLNKKLKK